MERRIAFFSTLLAVLCEWSPLTSYTGRQDTCMESASGRGITDIDDTTPNFMEDDLPRDIGNFQS